MLWTRIPQVAGSLQIDLMAQIKEKPSVPTKFPAAKLFLDDILEISDLFRDALQSPTFEPNKKADIEFVFGFNGNKFDSADDLRGPRPTTEFFIRAKRGSASIELESKSSYKHYAAYGLPDDVHWALYGKLKLVFEGRPYGRLDKFLFVLRRFSPGDWFLFVVAIVNLVLLQSAGSPEFKMVFMVGGFVLLGGLGGGAVHSFRLLKHVWTLVPRGANEKPRLLHEFLAPKTVASALWVIFGMLIMWVIERLMGGSPKP